MSHRSGAGVLLTLTGLTGLAGFGYLLYGPDDSSGTLIAIGMPGDLLAASVFTLMLLGGLGLMLKARDPGR